MRYLKRDDDEYWENPERLDRLAHPDNFMSPGTNPKVLELLRSVKATYFTLGDPDRDDIPVATLVQMPPEYALPHHAHSCAILMVVISGSLYVPGRILEPGDVLEAGPNEFYGPEVAGPGGCTRIEFFAELTGNTSLLYKLPNGEVRVQKGLEGEAFPKELMGTDTMLRLIREVRAEGRRRVS